MVYKKTASSTPSMKVAKIWALFLTQGQKLRSLDSHVVRHLCRVGLCWDNEMFNCKCVYSTQKCISIPVKQDRSRKKKITHRMNSIKLGAGFPSNKYSPRPTFFEWVQLISSQTLLNKIIEFITWHCFIIHQPNYFNCRCSKIVTFIKSNMNEFAWVTLKMMS